MESIENPFNGAPNFGKKVTCTIQRNGDLIYRMYLQATLPSVSVASDASGTQFRWLNWPGHNLISSVEIEIGGQRIDKHYGEWLHLWNELTQEAGKQAGYAKMVGNVPALVNCIIPGGSDCDADCGAGIPNTSEERLACTPEYTLYIPFQFWFNRNAGLALPLIALQYHEVRINLEFNELRNMCWDYATSGLHPVRDRVASTGLVAASLYIDYIYLDTDERRKFAQVAHEYLIETLQFTGGESITSSSNKIKLNFNHPCKELVWVVQRDSYVSCSDAIINDWKGQQPFNYSDFWDRCVLESGYSVTRVEGMAGKNPVVAALLQLNGHDRFSIREGRYFNEVQPYQHHTNVPTTGVNVYSFALQPEQHQPSGTCNFSRIDNAVLQLTISNNAVGTNVSSTVRVYATNYNVLRIMSGMGGNFIMIYGLCPVVVLCSQEFYEKVELVYMGLWKHKQATLSNCGKLVLDTQYRLGTERSVQVHHRETCGYGKNLCGSDNPQPSAKDNYKLSTHAVQRLNGNGLVEKTGLRYSPSAWKQDLQEEFCNFHMVAKGELVRIQAIESGSNVSIQFLNRLCGKIHINCCYFLNIKNVFINHF